MRIKKITIAYDGKDFSGWQRQLDTRTVQGTLETAWEAFTKEAIGFTGSGRTDSGVHALAQVASVRTATHLENRALLQAMNANLPEDVIVTQVEDAPEDFHAIRCSQSKRYRYQIWNERLRPIFARGQYWHVPKPLDVRAMQLASKAFVGEHDFVSFQSSGSERDTTIRTIYDLVVEEEQGRAGGRTISIEVEGNGFLYNMVRIIAGTLVEIGIGKHPVGWAEEALLARVRKAAGQTAPPQGLFLVRVNYGAGE